MKFAPAAAPPRGIPLRLRAVLRGCVLGGLSAVTLGLAAAQPAPALPRFLAALGDNPELLAAQAAVEAAELQLQAAYDPVALEATGGYSRFSIDESKLTPAQVDDPTDPTDPTDPGGDFASGTLPSAAFQLSTTLVFRPIPFGDTADLVRQSELELESSRLDLRAARTGLEVRALEAALGSRLAERSAELAQEGASAAAQGLVATRKRAEKGAANDRELRDAEAALFEAQTRLENAQVDAETARLNLQNLVGDTPAPSYAELSSLRAPPAGTPLAVAQAQVQTQLAELGIGAAQRELYPVAQASYNWNVSDTSALTASLESRTLQPSLGFSYQDPGRTAPNSAVVGTFQLGISANISVGALSTLQATERQRDAAQGALDAQRLGGTLQATSLRATFDNAARSAELERRSFENAQLTYQENVTRQELGLSAPLETQTSLLDLLTADLERRDSERAALGALLDIYELYALPPSEALP